jgi:electron transfer flavoprotein alpha subunit
MAILLVAEHDNASLKDGTAKVLTAAKAIGGDIDVLVAGEGVGAVAEAAAKLGGVRKVLVADGAGLKNHIAEALEALIVPLAANYDTIIFAADTTGKNAAPRIAAKLDVMQISEIVSVEAPDTFTRPIYAGNALMTVKSTDAKRVITVRLASFQASPADGSAPVEAIGGSAAAPKTSFVGQELSKSDRPELVGAKRIVSGGRALGSSENFVIIEKLADRIGAAVGASRAAVDAGYAPNDYQVGQTGKIVAPELYVAVGISGAIQHLAGMKDSKVIVAINKDEEAPIFQVADYGLVGDLFKVVPELVAALDAAGV